MERAAAAIDREPMSAEAAQQAALRTLQIVHAKAKAKFGGPFPQRAAFEAPAPRPTERQVGRVGLPRDRNGVPLVEPNLEHLHPYQARGLRDDPGVYEEMVRGDGTIGGLDGLLMREIREADWRVIAPRDATALEAEVAEWMARYLGLDGTEGHIVGGFAGHIELACRALRYGFAPFELTWSSMPWRGAQHIAPSGVHYRAPQSVKGWAWDRDRLAGMVQLVPRDVAAPWQGQYLIGQDEVVTIPDYRLLVYSHGWTPGNPEGVSLWRSSWPFWAAKKAVLLRYMVAADRLVGGTVLIEELDLPSGAVHPSVSDVVTEYLGEIVDAWFDGELNALIKPAGYRLVVTYPEAQLHNPAPVIDLLNHEIRQSSSGQLFGLNARPGQGLASGLAQMLLRAIHGFAVDLARTTNGRPGIEYQSLLRRAARANFTIPEGFRWPKAWPTRIRFQDVKEWVDAITKALQFKGISWTPELEVQLREALELAELSPEQLQMRHDREEDYLDAVFAGPGGDQQRAGEEGTQAPVEPPEQTPDTDPDGA